MREEDLAESALERARARAAFRAVVEREGDALPLDEGCAWIAAEERPSLDVPKLLGRLDELARGLYVPPEAPAYEVVARLNHHLFEEWGFSGDLDDYEAPRNSLLDQVIQRRQGLPILLCVVYLEVARRVGAAVDGIGFPGHFLVAPRAKEEPRFFVDPFHGGRILREQQLWERLRTVARGQPVSRATFEQLTAPVNSRYVLVRINNNLKGAWLRRGDVPAALRAVERLLLLEPDLLEEQRDRGLMLAHLGKRDEALEELRTYLDRWPNAPDRRRIEDRIAELEDDL